MSTEVRSVITPWTPEALLICFDNKLQALGRGLPSAEALATLLAQSTLETGRGGKSCFTHNPSNIMGVSPEGLYHVLRKAPECAAPDKVPAGGVVLSSTNVACPAGFVPYLPASGSRFRAYSSLELGVSDKIDVLGRIWPSAVSALLSSYDAVAVGAGPHALLEVVADSFVKGLLKPAYFTADVPTYRRLTVSIAKEFLPAAISVVNSRIPVTPDSPAPALEGEAPLYTLDRYVPIEGIVLLDFLGSLANAEAVS